MRRPIIAITVCLLGTMPCEGIAQQTPPPKRGPHVALTIGGDDAPSDDYTFAGIRAVVSAKDGHIYVLDEKDCVVKVFDADGKFVRKFGARGSGPGEFTRPGGIVVTDTYVTVSDDSRRRVRFSTDGRHLSTTTDTTRFGESTYPLQHGLKLRLISAGASSTTGFTMHATVTLERTASARIDTMARIRYDGVGFQSSEGFGMLGSGFGNGGAWALSGDSLVAVVDGYTGAVKWYAFPDSAARLVRSASLGRSAVAVTSSEIAAMETRFRIALTKSAAPAPGIKFVDPPSHWSIATRAMFDSDAGLWIGAPPAKDSTILWTVFPARGPAYAVSLPSAFRLTSVRGDKLFGAAETAIGTPVVRVYRVAAR